jgi:hypothetical protein
MTDRSLDEGARIEALKAGAKKRIRAIKTAVKHPLTPEQKSAIKTSAGISAVKNGAIVAGVAGLPAGAAAAGASALANFAQNYVANKFQYYQAAMHHEQREMIGRILTEAMTRAQRSIMTKATGDAQRMRASMQGRKVKMPRIKKSTRKQDNDTEIKARIGYWKIHNALDNEAAKKRMTAKLKQLTAGEGKTHGVEYPQNAEYRLPQPVLPYGSPEWEAKFGKGKPKPGLRSRIRKMFSEAKKKEN